MTRLLHPVADAAEILGVGRSTIYRLIAAGEIGTVKIGRRTLVAQTELERYVATLYADAHAETRASHE